ncbi:MAG: short-chain fatty acid transporter [Sporomusa sp.]
MQKVTRFFVKMVQQYLPDAYLLAILLTFVVFLMGVFIAGKPPLDMVQYWGNGYPKLFTFGMQMVMVLLTGYVLALTPLAKIALDKITDLPKTPSQALAVTAGASITACYFNWAFGIVVGAFLAKEMSRKVRGLHFPLVVAAAYGGEIMRGPSSSIPLVSATKGHFMEKTMGIVPVTETLYSSWNMILSLIIVALLVALYYKMQPAANEVIEFVDSAPAAPKAEVRKEDMTFAERLENSYLINFLSGCLPLVYLIMNFQKLGFDLNLNIVVLMFLTVGLFLHKSPLAYLAAVKEAVVSCRGILIQFPFYAGIMGMINASGLVNIMSAWFISIATPQTFGVCTFLSAGLVNIFIPSGGGQWAIQGPIIMKAAADIGADKAQTIMAFAWGDGWTNQIQPFWALPLLGVAGLSARDIMGYCVIWTFISGLAISAMFLFLGFTS